MAGIGKYTKCKKFALKSGNATSFKMMGSSPLKQGDPEPRQYGEPKTLKEASKTPDPYPGLSERVVVDPVGDVGKIAKGILKVAPIVSAMTNPISAVGTVIGKLVGSKSTGGTGKATKAKSVTTTPTTPTETSKKTKKLKKFGGTTIFAD